MAARRTRAALAVCAALAALWWTRGRGAGDAGAGGGRAALALRRDFPLRAPHAVAHLLADFSTLPRAAPAPAPDRAGWRVEEERGNLSAWRYRVTWECGARCEGEATYRATELDPPAHAHAARHGLALRVRVCTGAVCDELEVEAEVTPDAAGGAVLRERARATCRGRGEGRGEGADRACEDALRAHRALHHARLAQDL